MGKRQTVAVNLDRSAVRCIESLACALGRSRAATYRSIVNLGLLAFHGLASGSPVVAGFDQRKKEVSCGGVDKADMRNTAGGGGSLRKML